MHGGKFPPRNCLGLADTCVLCVDRLGAGTLMRGVCTVRVVMLSVTAWWECSSAYLAVTFIHPEAALVLPIIPVALVHGAAALWSYFWYSADPVAHVVLDYGTAFFFLMLHLKAYKDLTEGFTVGWLKKKHLYAFLLSAILPVLNAVLFGVLADWHGQLMLEIGVVTALTLSALGTLQKTTEKMPKRYTDWYMRK